VAANFNVQSLQYAGGPLHGNAVVFVSFVA
jgi:hypothetical protein